MGISTFKKLVTLSVAIFIVFFFSRCGKTDNFEGKMIFKYNESAGISTLDPAFAKDQALIWACNQLYNGLVQLDDNLKAKECIAESWEISEDKKLYTFHLRNDVYFHNNKCFKNRKRKVAAQDFVYSFKRILDPKTASPGIWIFEHIDKNSIGQGFYAVNDSTLEIRLKEPFAPFLELLSMPYAYVVPKEAVDYYKEDFRKNPVGTGAFQFKFWKEGVKLVFVKNNDYFEKDGNGNSLPYLDAVNISFIIDKQSVFLEFVKGNIDFISGIDPNYKDEVLTRNGTLQEKYKHIIHLQKLPYLNTEYLGFYLDSQDKENILNNKYLRQAINYGFDRNKMIKYLRNNIGIASKGGIVPPSLLGKNFKDTAGYQYDVKKAKALLDKSGYNKNKPVLTLSSTSAYMDLCKYIQQQLMLLGMNVKLENNPPAELRQRMAEGKSSWFRGSWIADYPDAENYLSLFYSGNFAPDGPNYTHFKDKEFDRLYMASVRETDPQKRNDMYIRMNEIIKEQAPVTVLYYDEVLRFVRNNVYGLTPNAMNLLTLKTVYKK